MTADIFAGIDLPGKWIEQAKCAEVDPALFHPEKGGERGTRAKAICAVCPVREACLQYALARGGEYDYGIWGGTSVNEREQIRRGMREAA